MKRGNDFKVRLNVFRQRSPEDFTDSDITIIVYHINCPWIRFQPSPVVVNDNSLTFPINVNNQYKDGVYNVTITYRKKTLEGYRHYEVTACHIFQLSSSCCVGIPEEDYTISKDIDVQIEADGKDGITPHIGENGNWWLADYDTGKPSRGEDGYSDLDIIQIGDVTTLTDNSTSEDIALVIGKATDFINKMKLGKNIIAVTPNKAYQIIYEIKDDGNSINVYMTYDTVKIPINPNNLSDWGRTRHYINVWTPSDSLANWSIHVQQQEI